MSDLRELVAKCRGFIEHSKAHSLEHTCVPNPMLETICDAALANAAPATPAPEAWLQDRVPTNWPAAPTPTAENEVHHCINCLKHWQDAADVEENEICSVCADILAPAFAAIRREALEEAAIAARNALAEKKEGTSGYAYTVMRAIRALKDKQPAADKAEAKENQSE